MEDNLTKHLIGPRKSYNTQHALWAMLEKWK